jgi:hypothetical protein
MAQDALVVGTAPPLTEAMVQASHELLERLDRLGTRAAPAFWVLDSEAQRWKFVVATSLVIELGPRAVYAKVHRAAPRAVRTVLGPSEVVVVSPYDPVLRDLETAPHAYKVRPRGRRPA